MIDPEDYEKTKLCIYQWPIGKLMYLVYEMRSEIVFVIEQLNKYNANPRKSLFQAIK